ncbi:sulfate transporter family protein [Marssonina coronariae]|uniref:Sulfate transporter family protein n=1 Tax=Diplocarpon coronariae TaxID=2795749 RepID=A0A218Z185_9HELO|nr:sulfate transporter family protein [Marssonina coronariae]
MSLPTSGFVSSRRLRAPSVGSHSSPKRIPDASDADDGTSNAGLDYAHADNTLTARSVREDTAELASYALSDKASVRSVSPPRQRSAQTSLESYFGPGKLEGESSPIRNIEGLQNHPIPEGSEPVSPENSSITSDRAPGTSVLTKMLKNSPPETRHANDDNDSEGEHGAGGIWGDDRSRQGRLVITSHGVGVDPTESTSLLGKSHHPDWIRGEQDIERQATKQRPAWPRLRDFVLWPQKKGLDAARTIANPKAWDLKVIWTNAVVEPVSCLPAVVLGNLLNILDALSYGMILFPLGNPIFGTLGAAGISMFYVSCIISQLVYSSGGSRFKGGVGSEMIEVVPFFHKMAFTILGIVGEEHPDSVIATTITAYALSSILTGLVFFLMGVFNCGYIVGFIPRHILIGCIGGVGFFLIVTGLEITARLDGNLHYDIPTLKKLFELETFILWITPFLLAVLYFSLKTKVQKTYPNFAKYDLPVFILCIPAVFYFFVLTLQELEPEDLRETGWIFEAVQAGEPWWHFYTLYDFGLVHWGALAETIPSMFALTFFGILHVPINVPSLAFSIGEDDLDLDRELIAHGISNALSGCAGSIQNYLVYTNSLLFINSGGNSRMAGFMLAICTAGTMLIGPVIVGYIPVMMVGVLIFVLGFELLFEAVIEPREKLKPLEYLTVIAIVLVMGVYDFVVGIAVGIGLAFISLIVQTSRIPAVRASFSGQIAGSTVRRNATQRRFLEDVGQQIHVTKLGGYLFFGTIVSVEERIRALVEDQAFSERPIRYLILDLRKVDGVDYSAAEVFQRLKRILKPKGVTMLMSGVKKESSVSQSLHAVGLIGDGGEVKMFDELNSALESCENELLKIFYASKEARVSRNAPTSILAPGRPQSPSYTIDAQFSSPRRNQLHRAATTTLDNNPGESKYLNFKEPLRLILQTFQGLTEKNEDFWFKAIPFFVRKEYLAGTTLFQSGEPAKGFYLLEDGILRADYELPQGRYFESIVAGTTCGELPFFSETDRTATVQAERDCVTWLMDREDWEKLQTSEPAVAQELLRISLKLTSERMSAITSYVLTTAG